MPRRWEPVEEEVVGEEEERVEEEYEAAGEEEERVEDEGEEVVGGPEGDEVAAYIYGVSSRVPSGLGLWSFPWLIAEYRRAAALGDEKRAKRVADLIFAFCPAKPHRCPFYSLASSCIYGMERRCRPRAFRRRK